MDVFSTPDKIPVRPVLKEINTNDIMVRHHHLYFHIITHYDKDTNKTDDTFLINDLCMCVCTTRPFAMHTKPRLLFFLKIKLYLWYKCKRSKRRLVMWCVQFIVHQIDHEKFTSDCACHCLFYSAHFTPLQLLLLLPYKGCLSHIDNIRNEFVQMIKSMHPILYVLYCIVNGVCKIDWCEMWNIFVYVHRVVTVCLTMSKLTKIVSSIATAYKSE